MKFILSVSVTACRCRCTKCPCVMHCRVNVPWPHSVFDTEVSWVKKVWCKKKRSDTRQLMVLKLETGLKITETNID